MPIPQKPEPLSWLGFAKTSLGALNPNSFRVCAVGSGVKGGPGRRSSMSCVVGSRATCSRFNGNFVRHQSWVSSFVDNSTVMILAGGIGGDSSMREVSQVD